MFFLAKNHPTNDKQNGFQHGIIFKNINVTKLSLFLNAQKKLGTSQLGFREAEAFTPFFNFQRFVFYFLSLGLHFGGNAQGGAALSLWNNVHMSQSPLWRKAQGAAALSLWSDVHTSDLGDKSCLCDQTDFVRRASNQVGKESVCSRSLSTTTCCQEVEPVWAQCVLRRCSWFGHDTCSIGEAAAGHQERGQLTRRFSWSGQNLAIFV